MRTRLNEGEKATAEQIVEMVAVLHRVTGDILRGPSQRTATVDARREAAVLLRKAGFSTPKIGEVLNRDHTTILHLLNTE